MRRKKKNPDPEPAETTEKSNEIFEPKKLNAVIKLIEANTKTTNILSLGGSDGPELSRISCGSREFNYVLGGGWGTGRVYEVYGPPSGGKTTAMLLSIAANQKAGKRCCYVDAEHAIDLKFARKLGVDTDNLLIGTPNTSEEGWKTIEHLVKADMVDFIVLDSLAAMRTKHQVEGGIGKVTVGEQAKLNSEALGTLVPLLKQTNCTLVVINQIRMKIGVMFGNPETTPGGVALEFYASARIRVRRKDWIKNGALVTGQVIAFKGVKNKIGQPMRESELYFDFEKGLNVFQSLVNELKDNPELMELCQLEVTNNGWWKYNGDNIAHGEPALLAYLEENPELAKIIESKVDEYERLK